MSVVRGGRSKSIAVILDSPEVRQLVSLASARQEAADQFWRTPHTREEGIRRVQDERRDPEKYSPGRKAFFEAMERAPHIIVKENTRVRVAEFSNVRCEFLYPEATVTYTRFTILNGPSKGQQVWICRHINTEPGLSAP
jgi:hypothetical protein